MYKVLLIGNPNVGKTTLFNSLTKSNEHTGNFHGVTVEEKHKIIEFNNEKYDFVDLPGMYSLNSYSFEEEVAKSELIKSDATRIVICDANSIRRNLYLCLQLNELGLKYKLLINNYDYFEKHGNKLNLQKLKKYFPNCEIINAKTLKLNKNILKYDVNSLSIDYLNEIVNRVNLTTKLDRQIIIKGFNGILDNLSEKEKNVIENELPNIIAVRYNYIDEILKDCIEINKIYVYGKSRADKFLLKPFIMIVGFFAVFFLSIYCIFFLIGPFISDCLVCITNFIFINPITNFLNTKVSNVWLTEFFAEGVFSSFTTVLAFLPQICLLFLFLTLLEDSGIIARMAYVFDDLLSKVGLNGKAIYIMLMGLGCNTMSAMASRNMTDKNLKIKTAILNPFISCMARLPIFVIVASAFFGAKAYFVIVGLYLLGLSVALIFSAVLNKTILKNKPAGLLLEFPPLRGVDFKHALSTVKVNAVDFVKRVFTTVLMVGIVVYILLHTKLNFTYTNDVTNSILYFISSNIAFLFKPIGLGNPGIISALIVGLVAKELIVSIFSITNGVASVPALITSLSAGAGLIAFTPASAISFLIFTLLYSPCASTMAVIKKETGKFWMWFNIISQLSIAYLLSFIIYNAITKGILFTAITIFVIVIIVCAIYFVVNRVVNKKCIGCNKCAK